MTKASYFTLQNQISDFHHRLLGLKFAEKYNWLTMEELA
jgi:hypothetical protein